MRNDKNSHSQYRKRTMVIPMAVALFLSGCVSSLSHRHRSPTGVRTIEISRELPYPAPYVFEKIFKDFSGIAKFHPGVAASGYVFPPLNSREPTIGDSRYVWFKEDGSEVAYERLVEFEPQLMRMRFQIYDTKGLPLDTEHSFGTSWLEPISANKSRFNMRFEYRTRPKFLAFFAEHGINEDLVEMAEGIEAYLGQDAIQESVER